MALATCLMFMGAPLLADVKQTVHNMLADPKGPIPKDSREICAFCHFPQGGSAQAPGWVRNGNGNGTAFKTFPTLGISQPLEDGSSDVGNLSLACLSCHDGTQALSIPVAHRDGSHPVAVPYAFGRYRRQWTTDSVEVSMNQRVLDDGYPMPEVDFVNRNAVWWVETGEIGRQKSDLQLYSRRDRISGTEIPFVECSTCHDPHGDQPLFLRISNDRSAICLTCHQR